MNIRMPELMDTTPWRYVTSEEKAISVLLTFAAGKLYLQNDESKEEMTINYKMAGAGLAKGLPIGASESKKSYPSTGGFVQVARWKSFGRNSFPCHGYMYSLGATVGLGIDVVGDCSGGSMTIALFGLRQVFAALAFKGLGNSVTPSYGISASLVNYWVE